MQDPHIRELGKRLRFVDDESYAIDMTTVSLHFEQRDAMSMHIEHARGSVHHPMSDAELEAKFHALSNSQINATQANHIIQRVWNFEELDSTSNLLDLIRIDA